MGFTIYIFCDYFCDYIYYMYSIYYVRFSRRGLRFVFLRLLYHLTTYILRCRGGGGDRHTHSSTQAQAHKRTSARTHTCVSIHTTRARAHTHTNTQTTPGSGLCVLVGVCVCVCVRVRVCVVQLWDIRGGVTTAVLLDTYNYIII